MRPLDLCPWDEYETPDGLDWFGQATKQQMLFLRAFLAANAKSPELTRAVLAGARWLFS